MRWRRYETDSSNKPPFDLTENRDAWREAARNSDRLSGTRWRDYASFLRRLTTVRAANGSLIICSCSLRSADMNQSWLTIHRPTPRTDAAFDTGLDSGFERTPWTLLLPATGRALLRPGCAVCARSGVA